MAELRRADPDAFGPPEDLGGVLADAYLVRFDLAELLTEQAYCRRQTGDARMAAELFERAANAADGILPRYRAYEANRLLFELTGQPAALQAAADHLDGVLALHPAWAFDLVAARTDGLEVKQRRIEAVIAAPANPGRSAVPAHFPWSRDAPP